MSELTVSSAGHAAAALIPHSPSTFETSAAAEAAASAGQLARAHVPLVISLRQAAHSARVRETLVIDLGGVCRCLETWM